MSIGNVAVLNDVRLSDVRKGEVQQVIRKPQSQEMMFQLIGDYVMDVNWMHFGSNLTSPNQRSPPQL